MNYEESPLLDKKVPNETVKSQMYVDLADSRTANESNIYLKNNSILIADYHIKNLIQFFFY